MFLLHFLKIYDIISKCKNKGNVSKTLFLKYGNKRSRGKSGIMSENKKRAVHEKQSDAAAFSIINLAIRNLHYILISGAAAALLVFLIVTIFVSPTYEVRTSFYVYNTSASESSSVNSSDMQAAKNLAATYSKILGSNAVIDAVINDLDDTGGYSRTDLRNNVRVNGVSDTQVIEVKVMTDNRDLSYQLADSFSRVAPKEVIRIGKVGNLEVLDQPEMPNKKSSPKTLYDTMLGFLVGAMLAFGVICLRAISDTTVYNSADVDKAVGLPVLGSIPEIKNSTGNKPWTLREGGVVSYDEAEAR